MSDGVSKAVVYRVRRVERLPGMTLEWDGADWCDVAPLELACFMGDRPLFFPRVGVKLLHDQRGIGVLFRVDDRYVRAVAPHHQGPVWRDSCVEFFFCPSDAPDSGYLNIEINCGGTMLFHHQLAARKNVTPVSHEDLKRVETAHSLPVIVDPEIAEPIVWYAAYQIPVDLIAKYCSTLRHPGPAVAWRANFYKCAENNSHPHWLTWTPVQHPTPNFHLPEQFGTILFE